MGRAEVVFRTIKNIHKLRPATTAPRPARHQRSSWKATPWFAARRPLVSVRANKAALRTSRVMRMSSVGPLRPVASGSRRHVAADPPADRAAGGRSREDGALVPVQDSVRTEPARTVRCGSRAPTCSTAPLRGRAAVLAAVRERRRTGAWRLPPFATNGDRRLFRKLTCVLDLVAELPPMAERAMLGEQAAAQTLAAEREALVMRLIEASEFAEPATAMTSNGAHDKQGQRAQCIRVQHAIQALEREQTARCSQRATRYLDSPPTEAGAMAKSAAVHIMRRPADVADHQMRSHPRGGQT